ncbi:MAG TPA: S41 family peptidase [Longimicrobiales bacterium]|nr:S41 family peptidase [Longimicrobiales bacterium]
MRRILKRVAVASIVVPVLVLGVIAMGHTQDAGARLFQQVFSRVEHDAIDTLGSQELYEKAARGLIDQLGDPYADLYSPEQLARFSRQAIGNAYGGVGMQIEDQQGMITVMRVFPNTPARSAGVQAGDRIIGVDGQSTRGWKIDAVSNALLGTPGTKVNATFARVGVDEPIHVEFTRARVHVPAVPYTLMMAGDVGYIPLQRFNDAAAGEVEQAMDTLSKQGARAFVLDLRGNPGGSLDQAIDIADLFVPKGDEIASVRYRSQPEDVFWARRDPLQLDVPTIVLADGYTASASEILAGALQDHDRALVVGTTTFGKGVVQNLFPLDGGWALKITTGKWYTPVGRSIQREKLGNAVQGANADTTAPRPIYHSDSGRVIYGGGGITPDLVVEPDTLTAPEQTLMREISPHSQQSYVSLYDLALSVKDSVAPGFQIKPEWRARYLKDLREAGVKVDSATYAGASDLINQWLVQRIASLAFGDSTAFRREAQYDTQLQTALDLLHSGHTLHDLFALAQQRKSTGAGQGS